MIKSKHLLLSLLLTAKSGVATTTEKEEIRDWLLGASHAINHAPRSDDGDVTLQTEATKTATWKYHGSSTASTSSRSRYYDHDQSTVKPSLQQLDEDPEDTFGPKIVSYSFGMLADAFGLVADTVRVTGDTASGVLGSSIKLVGTAVKSTASHFDSAGNWIAPNNKQKQQSWLSLQMKDEKFQRKKHRLRSLAGRSVKLMGTVVQEFGDVLVMTGAATESLGSLTASVAQDSVRALQDIANMAGDIADDNRRRKQPSNPKILIRPMTSPSSSTGPTISYGSYDSPPLGTSEDGGTASLQSSVTDAFVSLFMFISDDTGGVPSQAPELFVVFILCYLGAILTIGKSRETIDKRIIVKIEGEEYENKRLTGTLLKVTLLPFRILVWFFLFLKQTVCSRYILLLFGYLLLWLHVCHMSQIRSKSIHSNAEARGYKFALSSLQNGNSASRESVTWLNTQLKQVWRISSATCPRYPDFVLKGMKSTKLKGGFMESAKCSSYGGLEPFLSWSVGDGLKAVLDNSNIARARSIAYVSLESISLGSHAPQIRHVESLEEGEDGRTTDYLVEVDLNLDDLSLVLGIELSSLKYAMLPTTTIAVGSLLTNVKFKARTIAVAYPPFVSHIELSLVHLPDLSFRITPLDDGSGLQGVDLGSLPVIREWLQGAVREFLSSYVSPKFVSINLEYLYKHPSVGSAVSSMPIWKQSPSTRIRSLSMTGEGSTALKSPTPLKGREVTSSRANAPFQRSLLIKPKTVAAKLSLDKWREAVESKDPTTTDRLPTDLSLKTDEDKK